MIVEEINSSLISLILSVVAIWISIRTLRRQTKVDLFEKGFEVFNLLNETTHLIKMSFELFNSPEDFKKKANYDPYNFWVDNKVIKQIGVKITQEMEIGLFGRFLNTNSQEVFLLQRSKYLFGIKAYKKLEEFITLYKEYHDVLINRNLAEFKIKSEEIINLIESEDFKNTVLIMEKKLSIFWLKGVHKKEK